MKELEGHVADRDVRAWVLYERVYCDRTHVHHTNWLSVSRSPPIIIRRVLCVLYQAKVLKGENDIRDKHNEFTEVNFALSILI